MEGSQKPLALILARNLITSIATPSFLVDDKAQLLFYNEAAGALLGMSFEESGRLEPERWTATFGPFDEDGRPMKLEELQLTSALRDGRPAHAHFQIRSTNGVEHSIEASALPLVGADDESSGAMIIFWPQNAGSDE
jgi:PAS domain-containing protein